MYVWGDALVNYLSAIGYGQLSTVNGQLFRKYWPPDAQVIGKDILRFHAAIWPGMLISVGLPLPKLLFVHGFISVGGEKMSKSLGNAVDPLPLIEKYGADAVRYFLLREIPPTRDGDFTYAKFEERYNSDLAKGLGNFTARVVNLGARYIRGSFAAHESSETKKETEKAWSGCRTSMEEFRFDEALQATWGLISYGDRFVDESKPWELAQKDRKKFDLAIAELCAILANISFLIEPFLPETSQKISQQLGLKPKSKKPWQFHFKKGKALFPMV
jgi:methionyl-tRNA synthetase